MQDIKKILSERKLFLTLLLIAFLITFSISRESSFTKPVSEQNPVSGSTLIAENQNGFFKIPELGIKFMAVNELQGLEYSVIEWDSGDVSAYFSTKDLASINCPAQIGPIGSLTKLYKSNLSKNPEVSNSIPSLEAQTKDRPDYYARARDMGDFYIQYTSSTDSCIQTGKSGPNPLYPQIKALNLAIRTLELLK